MKMITFQSITLPYLHFITCVIVPEKEGVGVPFPYVYHLQLNLLNINAKLVMIKLALLYVTAFFKNVIVFCLKHHRVFLKDGHLF